MSTQYAGLCIGGPMAGQQAVAATNRLKVQERPPLRTMLEESLREAPEITVTDHTYNWLHTGGFGLWIIEGMNLHQAIEAMALAYAQVQGGKS